jgi:hypothetical protein
LHALYRGEAKEDETKPGGSCQVARANTPQQRRGASEAPESEDKNEDENEDEDEDKDEEEEEDKNEENDKGEENDEEEENEEEQENEVGNQPDMEIEGPRGMDIEPEQEAIEPVSTVDLEEPTTEELEDRVGWPSWLSNAVDMMRAGERGGQFAKVLVSLVRIEKALGFKGEKTVSIN